MRVVLLVLVLAIASCGRADFDPLASDGALADGSGIAGVTCTSWSSPVLLANINTALDDWDPARYPDGRFLIFSSTRAGSGDLYRADAIGGEFGAPALLPTTVNDPVAADTSPAWNHAGTHLYFSSNRGGFSQLYESDYDPNGDVFSPAALVAGLETVQISGTTISDDETEMYYGVPDGNTVTHLHRATRSGGVWTDVGVIPAIDAPVNQGFASVSSDGLALYIASERGGAVANMYVASRPSRAVEFGVPVLIAALASPYATGDPDLSLDQQVLTMSSTRPTGVGGSDLYESTRTCN